MDKFRVWFGFSGESYAGEDPGCPPQWRGSGCYDIFEETEVLAVADIWCKEEHIQDKVLELIDKEFDVNLDVLEITKYVWITKEDDDDPDEYVDDWHIIKEGKGVFHEKLTMVDFAKFPNLGVKVYPGDVFFSSDGKIIEIL